MLDTLLDKLLTEWKIITQAPLSFIICVLFVGVIVYIALEKFHEEKEKTQTEHINLLTARLDESRLAVKTTAEAAAKPLMKNAEQKFHIYGDDRTPTQIAATNIWRWYYFRNLAINIDPETKKKEQVTLNTIFFVTFDQPVAVGTFEINSPDMTIPKYEVKEFNNRFAIIVFDEQLPSGTLIFSVH